MDHPNKEVLIAIAEGKTVQLRVNSGLRSGLWVDYDPNNAHMYNPIIYNASVEWQLKPIGAELVRDQAIWVRASEDGEWVPRHFSQVANGLIQCYPDGLTSHTAVPGEWGVWGYYTTTNPFLETTDASSSN